MYIKLWYEEGSQANLLASELVKAWRYIPGAINPETMSQFYRDEIITIDENGKISGDTSGLKGTRDAS